MYVGYLSISVTFRTLANWRKKVLLLLAIALFSCVLLAESSLYWLHTWMLSAADSTIRYCVYCTHSFGGSRPGRIYFFLFSYNHQLGVLWTSAFINSFGIKPQTSTSGVHPQLAFGYTRCDFLLNSNSKVEWYGISFIAKSLCTPRVDWWFCNSLFITPHVICI